MSAGSQDTQIGRTFFWEVRFPERTSYALGSRRPQAHIVISPDTPSAEDLSVPIAVARKLDEQNRGSQIAPVSRAELLYLIGQASRACARDRIARMIERRDYSSHEAVQKLVLDGYSQKVAAEVVERAVEVGLINDNRFASAFIRQKLASGWGERRIALELKKRGVALDEVEGWPEEFCEESEWERALAVAQRRSLSQRSDVKRMARFLSSRGFSASVSFGVARQVSDEATQQIGE